MSHHFYSDILKASIKYKKPLIVADIKLKQKSKTEGGKKSSNSKDFLKFKDERLRIMIALNNIAKNSNIIMAHVLLYGISSLPKMIPKKSKNSLDADACDLFKVKKIIDGTEKNINPEENTVVIKIHDTSTKLCEIFIQKWNTLMSILTGDPPKEIVSENDIINLMKAKKYKLVETHTPTNTPFKNPLYLSYLKFIKE